MGRHSGPLHPKDQQIMDVMNGYLEVPFTAGQTTQEIADWFDQNVALHVTEAADHRLFRQIPYDVEDLTPPLV